MNDTILPAITTVTIDDTILDQYSTVVINDSSMVTTDIAYGGPPPGFTITSTGNWSWSHEDTNITLGNTSHSKLKIYVVEPWQSNNPIEVEPGLWVSLEKDLKTNLEIKEKIVSTIGELHPDLIIKAGGIENISLVKREVNIEISNKGDV